MKKNNELNKSLYIISFFVTTLVYIVICIISNVYPFGDRSNLIWDLDIQYVEFFSYLKKLLEGNASLGYSMSKSLGGSLLAVFGYYLSSPLNILVVFFSQENLQLFVFVITLLKIGLASSFFSIYLHNRFDKISSLYCIVFSIFYALSQYMFCQMTNIMWLDGVYLLPIILLGVWKYIKENKLCLLYFSIACSVLFNWYTGYMNCLFIPFYFLVEMVLSNDQTPKCYCKKIICKTIYFCWVELLGVLLSSFLFLPVIYCLLQGKGAVESGLLNWETNGNFFDIFRGFLIGNPANSRDISLYCGIFMLCILFSFFLDKNVKIYEKRALGIYILFALLNCFIVPLEKIWNGFRRVDSYFYRYSYLMIFVLLFVAMYYLNYYSMNKKIYIISSSIIFFLFCFTNLLCRYENKRFVITLFFIILYCIIFATMNYQNNQRILSSLMLLVILSEVTLNGFFIFTGLYCNRADNYVEYVSNENRLIDSIRNYDPSNYRMEVTEKRSNAANLNENMSYGYWGVSHYSSAFDSNVATFYQKMGYASNSVLSKYDEPILPADSFLGVKYIISEKEYKGLEKVCEISKANNKQVYLNKYVLPFAFKVDNMISETLEGENPFESINYIYSNIIGENINLFRKMSIYEKNISKTSVRYTISSSEIDNIVYGIANSNTKDLNLAIDNKDTALYNTWESRYVFYVGDSKNEHIIEFQNKTGNIEDVIVQFWMLDLDELDKVTNLIRSNSMNDLTILDGYISGTCYSENNYKMLLTIPYADGWRITINGKEKSVKKAFDTFMVLNIPKGKSEIVLKYCVPWLKQGILLSLISIALFVITNILEKMYYECKNKK